MSSGAAATTSKSKGSESTSFGQLSARWSRAHSYVVLVALTLLCLLPFSSRAFQVDDTLFVWAGQHIVHHPGDPYGFKIIWDTNLVSMSDVTQNPPLACYYAALIGATAGWSETALHLGFLLAALALVLGTYRLAQRFTKSPLLAAAATLLTPGVLVSASSVMCDTLMLALWIWAVIFWVEGLESNRHWLLFASAVAISACGLTKYFGVSLIPLLLAYSLAKRRRMGTWVLHFLVPLGVFAAYQCWTKALYGHGLLLNAAQFATGQRAASGQPFVLANTLMCISFIGGCAFIVLIFTPLLWKTKYVVAGAVAAALTGLAVAMGWWKLGTSLQAGQVAAALAKHWLLVAFELMLCIGTGLSVFGLAISDTWRKRFDPDSLLLLLWISGTFIFAGFLNWTINARSVLPLIPAAAILLARRVEQDIKPKHAILALAISGVFALWITQADTDWADSSRLAAQIIHEKEENQPGTLWFQGHWGFQYYMQQLGARPIDFAHTALQPGDMVVIPQNNAETYKLKKQFMASAELLELPLHQFASTMRWEIGAGFYSATWGPLPFAFGDIPPEQYYIFRVTPIPAGTSPWEDPFAGQKQ